MRGKGQRKSELRNGLGKVAKNWKSENGNKFVDSTTSKVMQLNQRKNPINLTKKVMVD